MKRRDGILHLGRACLLLLVIWGGGLITAGEAYAAAPKLKTIEINVETSIEPHSAVGLLISASGSIQQPVKDFRRADDHTLIVPVPYNEENLPKDTVATAVVFSEKGQAAFGDVRPVFSPDPRDSFLTIPDCAPEKISEAALQGQLSLLESLVQVRAARRGVAQVKVIQLMHDEFLERLKKLERGFGLIHPVALSPDMPPVQLLDRLSRLLHVIQELKSRQPAPAAGAQDALAGKKTGTKDKP